MILFFQNEGDLLYFRVSFTDKISDIFSAKDAKLSDLLIFDDDFRCLAYFNYL